MTLRQGGVAALLALMLFGDGVSNLGALRNGAGFLRDQTAELDGALAAMHARDAEQRRRPAFQPEPEVGAADQREARTSTRVADLGSPAPTAAQACRDSSSGAARAVDSTLHARLRRRARAGRRPPGRRRAHAERRWTLPSRRAARACGASPQGAGSTLDVAVPGGAGYRSTAAVRRSTCGGSATCSRRTLWGGVSSGAPVDAEGAGGWVDGAVARSGGVERAVTRVVGAVGVPRVHGADVNGWLGRGGIRGVGFRRSLEVHPGSLRSTLSPWWWISVRRRRGRSALEVDETNRTFPSMPAVDVQRALPRTPSYPPLEPLARRARYTAR